MSSRLKASTALMISAAHQRGATRHNFYSGVDSRTRDYKKINKHRRDKIAGMMKSDKKRYGRSEMKSLATNGVYNI